jgi:hypothetical protein
MFCCHNRRQLSADYTDLFAAEPETAKNRPETGRPGVEFKPIQAALRLSARAACNYTKRPEVTAAPRPVDGSSPSQDSATAWKTRLNTSRWEQL